jgi:hypothetical protein
LASICTKITYKESFSTLIFSKSLSCFSMLLNFCLVVYNFSNISLFSSCIMYNYALSFYSFSKTPYKFWTNMSFSFVIYLFMISRSKSLSIMLVICVLYFVACWNKLATFLCSSNFCIDPNVWNLRVCPLKLVFEVPRFMCEV